MNMLKENIDDKTISKITDISQEKLNEIKS
jgi:hypothetical protein